MSEILTAGLIVCLVLFFMGKLSVSVKVNDKTYTATGEYKEKK